MIPRYPKTDVFRQMSLQPLSLSEHKGLTLVISATANMRPWAKQSLRSFFKYNTRIVDNVLAFVAEPSAELLDLLLEFNADIVTCEFFEKRPLLGPKSAIYSAPFFSDAEKFIYLDLDTWVIGDIAQKALTALQHSGQSVAVTSESTNWLRPVSFHFFEEGGIYNGTPEDMQFFSEEDIRRLQSSTVLLNSGFFVAEYDYAVHLYVAMSHKGYIEWLNSKGTGFTDHREQALFNLAILRGEGFHLLPKYFNLQMMNEKLERLRPGPLMVHFNGSANPDGPSRKAYTRLFPEFAEIMQGYL
jgi:hypothetical protein